MLYCRQTGHWDAFVEVLGRIVALASLCYFRTEEKLFTVICALYFHRHFP